MVVASWELQSPWLFGASQKLAHRNSLPLSCLRSLPLAVGGRCTEVPAILVKAAGLLGQANGIIPSQRNMCVLDLRALVRCCADAFKLARLYESPFGVNFSMWGS